MNDIKLYNKFKCANQFYRCNRFNSLKEKLADIIRSEELNFLLFSSCLQYELKTRAIKIYRNLKFVENFSLNFISL